MLARGLAKRCPLCGSRGLFEGWFRMRERCPGCGHRFEREEGFFLGAYVVNLGITEGLLLLLVLVPLVALAASGRQVPVVPVMAAAMAAAVLAPVAFYPFSRTIWAAIDLILRPASAREPPDRS